MVVVNEWTSSVSIINRYTRRQTDRRQTRHNFKYVKCRTVDSTAVTIKYSNEQPNPNPIQTNKQTTLGQQLPASSGDLTNSAN